MYNQDPRFQATLRSFTQITPPAFLEQRDYGYCQGLRG